MNGLVAILALSVTCWSPVIEACTAPWIDIRDGILGPEKCILIDSLERGTWYDMRLFCATQAAGADLVQITTANELAKTIELIYEFGLDRANYWIGGSDEAVEGDWVYPNTLTAPGSKVPQGTPFWKYDCQVDLTLRPQTDLEANCAALDLDSHFLIADYSCLEGVGDIAFSPICEMP